jgi:hypothetical protein
MDLLEIGIIKLPPAEIVGAPVPKFPEHWMRLKASEF